MTPRSMTSQMLQVVSTALLVTRCMPRVAWQFWAYWKRCQLGAIWHRTGSRESRSPGLTSDVEAAVSDFARNGYCTYSDPTTIEAATRIKASIGGWFDASNLDENTVEYDGDLSLVPGIQELFQSAVRDIAERLYGCYFRVFFGKALRSQGVTAEPDGSFLWHADGGPSPCIHALVHLDDTDERNGATVLAPKGVSRRLLVKSVAGWQNL